MVLVAMSLTTVLVAVVAVGALLEAQMQSRAMLVGGLLSLALVVSLVAGRQMRRQLVGPLADLEEGTRKLRQGDLSARVEVSGEGELGRVAAAFNTMAARLESDQNELLEASRRDALTGLYNRGELHRRMQELLGLARDSGEPVSMLLLDVDFFKKVNDTYGHPAGDDVLVEVASRVAKAVRTEDTVARYGGEEFAVMLPTADPKSAAMVAERLRQAVSGTPIGCETEDGRKHQLTCTVSVGGATFPTNAQDIDGLMMQADAALYHSKETGRNRVSWQHPNRSGPTVVAKGSPRSGAARDGGSYDQTAPAGDDEPDAEEYDGPERRRPSDL